MRTLLHTVSCYLCTCIPYSTTQKKTISALQQRDATDTETGTDEEEEKTGSKGKLTTIKNTLQGMNTIKEQKKDLLTWRMDCLIKTKSHNSVPPQ